MSAPLGNSSNDRTDDDLYSITVWFPPDEEEVPPTPVNLAGAGSAVKRKPFAKKKQKNKTEDKEGGDSSSEDKDGEDEVVVTSIVKKGVRKKKPTTGNVAPPGKTRPPAPKKAAVRKKTAATKKAAAPKLLPPAKPVLILPPPLDVANLEDVELKVMKTRERFSKMPMVEVFSKSSSSEILGTGKKVSAKTKERNTAMSKALKAKQSVLQTVVDTMTDQMISSTSHQSKRSEKIKLEGEIGQVHMNLLKLPGDASGEPTRVFFNAQLQTNISRLKELDAYFQENV